LAESILVAENYAVVLGDSLLNFLFIVTQYRKECPSGDLSSICYHRGSQHELATYIINCSVKLRYKVEFLGVSVKLERRYQGSHNLVEDIRLGNRSLVSTRGKCSGEKCLVIALELATIHAMTAKGQ
jgi:hypothetical protein